jgi:hypothetical protein
MNRLDEDYWCEGQLELFEGPAARSKIILSRATRDDTPAISESFPIEGPQAADQQLWDENERCRA